MPYYLPGCLTTHTVLRRRVIYDKNELLCTKVDIVLGKPGNLAKVMIANVQTVILRITFMRYKDIIGKSTVLDTNRRDQKHFVRELISRNDRNRRREK